ncbi:MAG: cytochrome P450 [Pseudomonadales bacterium]|nr:cytochrome P450 [Pseudomonadales bacterium]
MHELDLSSNTFVDNPYPAYEEIHKAGGLYVCESSGLIYVAAYPLVQQLFPHPNASSNRVEPLEKSLPDALKSYAKPLIQSLEKWLLFLDAPQHTKLRKLINPAFSSGQINLLEDKIHQIAIDLIEGFHSNNAIDLVAEYAYPLPVMVIANFFGCPIGDASLLKSWSDHLAKFLGTKANPQNTNDARNSIVEATDYFSTLLNTQKRNPKDNILQRFIDYQKTDKYFSDDHIVANSIALIFAGHETTTNLIANTLWCALRFKSNLKTPSNKQLTAFIEESLRFESPIQRIGRLATAPIILNNTYTVETGKRIILMMGAANRDPAVFNHPNVFLPERNKHLHLAFGFGAHLCSGANLARLETEIALKTLLALAPQLAPKFKPKWHYNLGFRAMQTLDVMLTT